MNGPNLPGNPHIMPDPRKQQALQQKADAVISERIRGSAVRIFEQLSVAYVLARELPDEVTGQPPASPELQPDELFKLADQAVYMAPFIYARLGYIPSPVPQDDPGAGK